MELIACAWATTSPIAAAMRTATPAPPSSAPWECWSVQAPLSSRSTRSEEHTSELQSLMRISYAVFCLKKKNNKIQTNRTHTMITTKHDINTPYNQRKKQNNKIVTT